MSEFEEITIIIIMIIIWICHALKSRTSRKRRERSYRSISNWHSKPEKKRRYRVRVEVVPVIIGCLEGGVEDATRAWRKIIGDEDSMIRIISTMQRTVLFEGKVLGGMVQPE